MELANCSLEDFIKKGSSIISMDLVAQEAYSLISILSVLQKQNIAHRDIKPGNILVFQNADKSYKWKLADFGLCLDTSQKKGHGFAGSYKYASPKLKRKYKCPNLLLESNCFKDDVYSLGVTLLETITGHRSYNHEAQLKLYTQCDNKKLVNLIQMMLQEKEELRPCF